MAGAAGDDPVGWAIVAIPEEDDYVWKISSETVPHLTLLYLGNQNAPETEAPIVSYLEHVANTSISRFGLSVDRRGELGPNQADVLFFDDDFGVPELDAARGFLLKNNQILDAFNSTQQFPKWIPHLTLGFPETPAHEDDRDYPGIHWVNFDRIALWTGDSTGPEFLLKKCSDSLSMSDLVENLNLEKAYSSSVGAAPEDAVHYGRRGMKWGVVHPRTGPGGHVVIDGRSTRATRRAVKRSGVHTLSNEDLKKLTERINLENNYSDAVSRASKVKSANAKAKVALDLGRTANEAVKFGASPVGQLILRRMSPSLANSAAKAATLGKAANMVTNSGKKKKGKKKGP